MLAREQGVNRYQRIVDFDFTAGDRYWQQTGPFWLQVRAFWSALERAPGSMHIDRR